MTILLLETIHPDAHALLAEYTDVRLAASPDEPDPAIVWGQVVAIVTRGRGRVTRDLIARSPKLRVVARCGVGLDNVDVQAAAEYGVEVIYAPGSTTTAVAEQTLLFILALVRNLHPVACAVDAGRWSVRDGYVGNDVQGLTLGIVGMGAIGRRVAELAAAFGMQIGYWNRSRLTLPYQALPLDQLLQRADVVSLHVALTRETHHLIGAEQLAQMKAGALLVNTARGAVIDEDALRVALANGHLGGFAADVLEAEPPAPEEPLLSNQRTLITPHVAALTSATYRAMCLRTAQNVLALLAGREPEAVARFSNAPRTGGA